MPTRFFLCAVQNLFSSFEHLFLLGHFGLDDVEPGTAVDVEYGLETLAEWAVELEAVELEDEDG